MIFFINDILSLTRSYAIILNDTHITLAESYKYLGICLDSKLSVVKIQCLAQKLKIKLDFVYTVKSHLSIPNLGGTVILVLTWVYSKIGMRIWLGKTV